MSEPLGESDLVAYVGRDDPESHLFNGQPGVVIDTGQMPVEVSVALAWGDSLCMPPGEVARIDLREYRERSDRMRSGQHPLRDENITPLDAGDPLARPNNQP